MAAAVAMLAGAPWFGNAYLVSFVFTILVAYILAQSWDWVAGEMGYINLGHYCFYGIGAYAFAIALVAYHSPILAFAVTMLASIAAAVVLGFPLFRLRGDYFAFATLALLPLAEVLAFNLTPITNGADGIVLPVHDVATTSYLIALAVCVVSFAITVCISRIRFGYALRSIRNDEEVAEVTGLRTQPVKLAALALSAMFAGIAGGIQAWQLSYIDPSSVFGLHVALVPIAMALLGGSGLRFGPLVGVVLLALVQQWLLVSITMLQATIYGLIILLIGRFMPGGILRSTWLARRRGPASPGSGTRAQQPFSGSTSAHGPQLPLPVRSVARGKPLLECRDVRMEFGGNVAIGGVSLRVSEGEIVGLIGPNGSGKTTLFNCISKVYEPSAGTMYLLGRDLRALRRDEVARLGVGRTYQNPRPLGDLTVRENIAVPLLFNDASLSPRDALSQAQAFLEYSELADRGGARADSLSLQEKKALEFARALACKPRLLLVDEVASGLTPAEVARFVEHIRHIRDRYGITVIWVEHIFSALAQVVDRVLVLEQGMLIADGSLADVVKDERVLRTYLGTAAAGAINA